MKLPDCVDSIPAAYTVCDREGKILFMNSRAVNTFEKWGGEKLIGENLKNCHPAPAREKLEALLTEPQINAYTIEKNGIKKLIWQAPWYEDGNFAGLVELSLQLPESMPHFVRR